MRDDIFPVPDDDQSNPLVVARYAKNNEGNQKPNKDSCGQHNKQSKSLLTDILWATLGEIAIVLWIIAELFSSVARPKIAVWSLGSSVALFFGYVFHKLLESDYGQRHKRSFKLVPALLCLLVVLGCALATEYLDAKWKSENEPQVVPSMVQLHDGKFGHISRVVISNPSDVWIYNLLLLIRVRGDAVPILSVKTFLSDPPSYDTFRMTASRPVQRPDFPMADSVWFDIGKPTFTGRIIFLYSLAPNEHRVLWIEGVVPTNSFAEVSILEYMKTPFSLKVNATNGFIMWPGPSSNSPLWRIYTNIDNSDMDFLVKLRSTQTNANISAPVGPKPAVGP